MPEALTLLRPLALAILKIVRHRSTPYALVIFATIFDSGCSAFRSNFSPVACRPSRCFPSTFLLTI